MNILAAISSVLLITAMLAASESAPVGGSLQVPIRVVQDCSATAVIDGADGTRVCNLISEMPVKAGTQSFTWDLYDVGWQQDEKSPYVRHRVKPGTYTVRGLTSGPITPKYEFSVYSQGSPPWRTDDGTGCWMADHTPPADALFLPDDHRLPWGKGKAMMVLTSGLAESGSPTVYTDLEGKVILAHGLCGKAVARDVGTKPVAGHALYFANTMDGFSGRQGLLALKEDGGTELILSFSFAVPVPMAESNSFVDLAVRDGIAVVSNSDNRDNLNDISGNLLVVDLRTKQVLANHQMAPTRGVCFAPDGRLLVVVDDALHRYVLNPKTGALSDDTVLVKDLVEPRRVRCDAKGGLYVGVWLGQHQIRAFDAQGKLVRTIGKPGGIQIGRYDEQRMQRPDGFGFDDQGRLWLAENCMTPKRISLWKTADGTFLRAIYGRVAYGGGGAIDPNDRTRFYYPCWTDGAGMLCRLDWEKGTWKPESIYYRPPGYERDWLRRKEGVTVPQWRTNRFIDCDEPLLKYNAIPIWGVQANGRRFVVVRAGAGFMQHQCTVWNLDGDVARPVGALGITWSNFAGGQPWMHGAKRFDEIKARFDAAKDSKGWAWSDLNGNGILDPEEFQILNAPGPDLDGFDFKSDLSALGFSLAKGLIPAPTWTPQGVPVWDLAKAQALPTPAGLQPHEGTPLLGKDDVVLTGNGWEIIRNYQGFRRDGSRLWTYRVYGQQYVPQFPGQLVHAYRAAGPMLKAPKGEAGELWCTHGLKGAVQLFTSDGLFLRTLGGDMRVTPLWRMKESQRGMPIQGVSFEDEDFGITIQQLADGGIYLVAGKEHSSILRIDGLETVKRRTWGTVTVTEAMLAGLPERIEEWPPTQMRKELDVLVGGVAPTVDGKLAEWDDLPPSAWATIDVRTSAAIRIVDDRLYAAFRTQDAKLLENSANDSRYAFKSGGALDLFLSVGPDNDRRTQVNCGDCRLLVTRIKGRPTAILYRPVGPTVGPEEKVQWVDDGQGHDGKVPQWIRPKLSADASCTFQSPIGKEVFAEVVDLSAQLQLAQDGGDYELSIPFRAVVPMDFERWGHQPWREQFRCVVGDLGIIRGNGSQNIQRLCWNSLDTMIVSDIPSEVRLKPQFWGQWNLIPAGNVRPLKAAPTAGAQPKDAKPGLAWDCWELPDTSAPWDFLALPPTASGEIERPGLGPATKRNFVGLRFRGWLSVPADGWYAFDVWGDSAARLTLGGQVIASVDWWPQSDRRNQRVELKAGTYAFELAWFKGPHDRRELLCEWSGPGFGKQPMAPERFRH